MKRPLPDFARHYRAALGAHLQPGQTDGLAAARGLGGQALAAGWPTLDLARLHEETLVAHLLPGCPTARRAGLIRKAAAFFAAAILPAEPAPDPGHLERAVAALSRRTVELAACNRDLGLEVTRRKAVEKALKEKERHYARVLKQSERLQEQLRRLSRQILAAQENERKEISRELHDMVAQTLASINVRLAALKKDALLNTASLDRSIARTQRLVERSVGIVHRFARELRPAALDDLGLIPALHSFLKHFTERTGVRTRLTAFAGVEDLSMARRTVLFRVAQEALTNVARHARASRVEVSLHRMLESVCMQVEDDGRSFQVQRVLLARGSKRLGLLGMRERLEMVGGSFKVESAPGKGTTIVAQVPSAEKPGTRKQQPAAEAAEAKAQAL